MAATLPISNYTENEKLWSVVPGGKMDQMIVGPTFYTPSYQPLQNRFLQILTNSVADLDYDDTLLLNKDRMNILSGREAGSHYE